MKKKILFLDSNHASLHEILEQAGFTCDLFFDKSDDELKSLIPEYEAIVLRSRFKITKEIIDSAKNLKCIARAGAGMENIEVEYANSKGIKCVHAPEGNRQAVAEHALGMLLSLLNNLIIADKEVRKGFWKREANRGYELQGKTIGIIGYGNTGSAFANVLAGFGVKILAYDKYKNNFASNNVIESDLKSIQKQSDIISLHLPLTNETRNIINEKFINNTNKPFYLINTARGACVNTLDLVNALDSGKVLGTCIDVLEFEKVSFEGLNINELPNELKRLFASPKTILTPHIAGWTHESHRKIAEVLAGKIIEVLAS